MARVDVHPLNGDSFEVTIEEDGSTSTHVVTATKQQVDRLGGGDVEPSHLVDASIRFLLDREPRESIMAKFDLDLISRFFPEYATVIGDYL